MQAVGARAGFSNIGPRSVSATHGAVTDLTGGASKAANGARNYHTPDRGGGPPRCKAPLQSGRRARQRTHVLGACPGRIPPLSGGQDLPPPPPVMHFRAFFSPPAAPLDENASMIRARRRPGCRPACRRGEFVELGGGAEV